MHTKMESLKLKFERFFMNNQSSREFVAYSLHTACSTSAGFNNGHEFL